MAACGAATLYLLAGISASVSGQTASISTEPVQVPKVVYVAGDVIGPLPPGMPLPPKDPRNFEGNWASLGFPVNVEGGPPPLRPEILAEMKRLKGSDEAGAPEVAKNTLCRPNGPLTFWGNQFPTQILQNAEKMLVIAEEGRTIWDIDLTGRRPVDPTLTYGGRSVGHWEGNTLVIESTGHRARPPSIFSAGNSDKLRLVTRITRANIGDPLNGERLVIRQTIDDPGVYAKTWTSVSTTRWRPDMQVMDFNCEESDDSEVTRGLVVK